MYVRVHTKDIKLTIPVPNALAFNHAVSLIASKALQKSAPSVQITPKQFDRLWVALIGVSVFVLVERIKEVRSGEEDDLSQY